MKRCILLEMNHDPVEYNTNCLQKQCEWFIEEANRCAIALYAEIQYKKESTKKKPVTVVAY